MPAMAQHGVNVPDVRYVLDDLDVLYEFIYHG
jgi:hypothetical protein